MKCQLTVLCKFVTKLTEDLKDIPLLILRLILAYGFYQPAMMKWKDINAIGDWFKSMDYPFPYINAYLAGITEFAGFILLLLGFGTRLISIPLMITMLVAIFTVHFSSGFAAGNNGFEIPLYYFVMLFTLLIYGSGKLSIDGLIKNLKNI
jgi:putative oxidoreductase